MKNHLKNKKKLNPQKKKRKVKNQRKIRKIIQNHQVIKNLLQNQMYNLYIYHRDLHNPKFIKNTSKNA